MQCLACNELIDDDSCFCDMCGVALTICASCRVPVAGKCCTKCGKPAVLASSLGPAHDDQHAAAVPKLRLRNKNLNIDLDVANNAVIGRTTGPYSSLFSKFSDVSGRHCQLRYDFDRGWCVTDLGSTFNTHYNNVVLTPNLPQVIGDGTFLKIATIEFFVSIGPS